MRIDNVRATPESVRTTLNTTAGGDPKSIVSAMYIHEGHTTHLQVGIQREKLKGQPLQVMGIYTTYDSARERSSESTIEEE